MCKLIIIIITFTELAVNFKMVVRMERAEVTWKNIIAKKIKQMQMTIHKFYDISFFSFYSCVRCSLYVNYYILLISRNFILLQINFDMSQGLSISVGTLIMEQLTGIYAELAFLDVALNFGQSLIAFAVFGLDPSLGKLGCWLQEMCRKWRSGTMNL